MKGAAHDKESLARWIKKNRFAFPRWGTWMIGREPNVPSPELYDKARLRVLIFRLSNYYFVSESMSHGLLGQLSVEVPDVYVDYGFMPPRAETEAMIRAGISPLFGTSSKRSFRDFDIVAFSNSVAQELVNLPWLLFHSSISFEREIRLADSAIPLLIMGGANAQSAFVACPSDESFPLSFVDALYFGEAEHGWPAVLEYLREARNEGLGKKTILREMRERFQQVHASLEGSGSKRCRATVKDLDAVSSLVRGPVWYDGESPGCGSIAIDSGCAFLCAFCKEAWESRPYRIRSVDKIVEDVEKAKRFEGLDRVNLFSFNATSHPRFLSIIDEVQKRVNFVQIKSQRFDLIARNRAVLLHQQDMEKRNFTFGLEGISERIRSFLHKDIEENEALTAIQMVLEGPLRGVKIFIILTGLEGEEDWAEFTAFLQKVAALRARSRQSGKAPFILSVTPLICMPHTPLQFHPSPSPAAIKDGVHRLEEAGGSHGFAVRESTSWEEARFSQALLFADGGQTEALIEALSATAFGQELSTKYIREAESKFDTPWKSWVWGRKNPHDRFPWDSLYSVSEKERLYELYEQLKTFPAMRAKRHSTPPAASRNIPRVKRKNDILKPWWFRVEVMQELAGVPLRFFQVALGRSLSLKIPDLSAFYVSPGPAVNDLEAIPASGVRLFSLYFRGDAGNCLSSETFMPEDEWGWSLCGHRELISCPSPEGALLELSLGRRDVDKEIRGFSRWLEVKSFKHHMQKKSDKTVFLFHRSCIKKAGCFFVLFDRGRKTLEMALPVQAKHQTLLMKGPVASQWKKEGEEMAPRIVNWWYRGPSLQCPSCGGRLLSDAFDGSPVRGELCLSLCNL